jgi:hypothetical protein
MKKQTKKSGIKPTTTTTKRETIIILPDIHARKEDLESPFELSRADLFKKLCADEHPDAIVCLGDVGEFDSVSSFDKDKPGVLAGKDLHGDVTVTLDFLERALGPKNKQNCFVQIHEGNHENRLRRVASQQPELRNYLDIEKVLQLDRFAHNFVGYDGSIPGQSLIDGILFAHFHVGNNAKAIAGLHTANAILQKGLGVSIVQAHSHRFDIKLGETRCDSSNGIPKRRFGLVAGCYIENDATFDYCGKAVRNTWVSGITILRGVDDGSFSEFKFVTLDQLRAVYGK